MENLPPRIRRLKAELENIQKLTEDSSFVCFTPQPADFPEEYTVTFSCLGLIAKPEWKKEVPLPRDWRNSKKLPPWIGDEHIAHIYLPAGYPEIPPQIYFKTPIFHPNITSRAKMIKKIGERLQLAEHLGGEEHLQELLRSEPELQNAHICLDGLRTPKNDGIYNRKLTLYDICHELGQIITYKRYTLAHTLDSEAEEWTRWAEKQENMLPIDNRPFLDKLPPVIVVFKDDEEINIEVAEER